MNLFLLALKSAGNRRASLIINILSIAISVFLLLGVDNISRGIKSKFLNTVSGTDLIVGAKNSDIGLLLYSVFHLGGATENVSYQSYLKVAQHPMVDWAVPISLGDSHRGFVVMGTTPDYFKHYSYGRREAKLEFATGKAFKDLYDVVVGSDVAKSLGYTLDQKVVINHGFTQTKYSQHADKPFRIVGVLKPTGTPIDKDILVSLEAITAIHIDWQSGTRTSLHISAETARKFNLMPKDITAFMLGIKNKVQIFKLQRWINDFGKKKDGQTTWGEPLMAILPGVVLAKLWQGMGWVEKALLLISSLVFLTALLGMMMSLFASLNERRREVAILRALGAPPSRIIFLFAIESLIITSLGLSVGLSLWHGGVALLPYINNFVNTSSLSSLSLNKIYFAQLKYLLIILGFGIVAGLLPGWVAVRRSLKDGLVVKS